MKTTFSRWLILTATTCSLTIPSLVATPVTGTLNISGDANVAATVLTFLCDTIAQGSQAGSCPSGYGNFVATGPLSQSGSFVPYANDAGFIKSINQTSQPINAAFNTPNFLYFSPTGIVANPDIALDLTFLYTGTYSQAQCGAPVAAGQTCTPILSQLISPSNPLGLSPFNLSNTQSGSSASFSVSGNARRISTGELSPFNGTFTAQFTSHPGTTDGSYQALLATVSNGGSINTSYSATFAAQTQSVPEPGTLTMLLGGMGLVGLARARRRRQS